ncbi:MAG: hemH [Caulobacter sp.]|nr:hemH [Caulobacter sp.]
MKLAVVLFNLGGPDGPAAVRPFLFNLFRDPAIISLPGPARLALAALISTTRAKSARANYAQMGGGSPLLAETKKQSEALRAAVQAGHPDDDVQVFIAMRYWHPFTEATAREVAAFAPDEIVLLPLYPQYSTTTSGSSLEAWGKAYKGPGRSRAVCCHPTLDGVIEGHARKIEQAYEAAGKPGPARLLFSAHGLPEQVIERGDPYQAQIEATAAAVAARLGSQSKIDLGDWKVCYQSRVGRLKWIGPSTEDVIREGADAGLALVVTPIAFVSEHIETLVELDIDYAKLAKAHGAKAYVRAPALGIEPAFIEALAGAVDAALARPSGVGPAGDWICPAAWSKCPRTVEGARA